MNPVNPKILSQFGIVPNSPKFEQTEMGRRYLMKTIPDLTKAINNLNETLKDKDFNINENDRIAIEKAVKSIAQIHPNNGDFYRTRQGIHYYSKFVPSLVKAIQQLNTSILEKEQEVIKDESTNNEN